MGTMRIMGEEGDTKIMWDPEQTEEVKNARKAFERLTKAGYHAFSVKKKGEKGEIVHVFDPDAEKLILAPPISGG